MFGKGAEGNAVIVARETHEGSYRKGINVYAPTGQYHHVHDYIADVTPDDGGEVLRTTFTEMFESDDEHRPTPTEIARVKIDKDNDVKFDRKALWEQTKAEKSAGHDKFSALSNAAPNSGPAGVTPAPAAAPAVTPSGADPLDQIAKAAELHRTGVLSNEEFAALKAKLLG
jgi:hypothetical protein